MNEDDFIKVFCENSSDVHLSYFNVDTTLCGLKYFAKDEGGVRLCKECQLALNKILFRELVRKKQRK
jgi:hypothetical protein